MGLGGLWKVIEEQQPKSFKKNFWAVAYLK